MVMGILIAVHTRNSLSLVVFKTLYLITRQSDLNAGISAGLIFGMLVLQRNWHFAAILA